MPCDAGLPGPADLFETALQRHGVVAAVGLADDSERLDSRQPVRHVRFRDQIAAPECDAIDAELAGGDVEQALAKEIGLVAARPAVGSRRRLVGHHQGDLDADIRNAIGPAQYLRDVARGGRAIGADIGALIGGGAAAQRQDGAVAFAGDLELTVGIAGMIGGHEMLAAILDPLDRPAAAPRRIRNQKVLG